MKGFGWLAKPELLVIQVSANTQPSRQSIAWRDHFKCSVWGVKFMARKMTVKALFRLPILPRLLEQHDRLSDFIRASGSRFSAQLGLSLWPRESHACIGWIECFVYVIYCLAKRFEPQEIQNEQEKA